MCIPKNGDSSGLQQTWHDYHKCLRTSFGCHKFWCHQNSWHPKGTSHFQATWLIKTFTAGQTKSPADPRATFRQCNGHFLVCLASFRCGWFLFLEDEGIALTVIADSCMHMLFNFLAPELQYDIELHTWWFQKELAMAYTMGNSMNILKTMFPLHYLMKWKCPLVCSIIRNECLPTTTSSSVGTSNRRHG